ncbi:MAG TPA: MotA/TolQ/ExbB proton channel family protein [Candidatus Limnocylindrales bacterium]|nr:MotA/TolQ/ExbB proton channel family protein [Candidatus Limnocylindrales bacterium]
MFENFDWIQAMRNSPVMVIIICCSVLTAGFALERAIYYWKRRGNPDSLLAAAMASVRSGNREEAVRVLVSNPHPMGQVAAEMVKSLGEPEQVTEEKLHIALSEQRLQLERNLGFIGTMGNTAPLIGLLGTVWGIMRAFHDMARTGSAGPSVVAAGVAEALFTTAAGLLVAVPAVILYNHFIRQMGVMLTVAENNARTLRLNAGPAAHRSQTSRVA